MNDNLFEKLCDLAVEGNLSKIKSLVSIHGAEGIIWDRPFIEASRGQHIEVMKFILDIKGVTISSSGFDTVMREAIQNKNKHMTNFLLSEDRFKYILSKSYIFESTCETESGECVEFVLSLFPKSKEIQLSNGINCACYRDNLEVVQFLLPLAPQYCIIDLFKKACESKSKSIIDWCLYDKKIEITSSLNLWLKENLKEDSFHSISNKINLRDLHEKLSEGLEHKNTIKNKLKV